MFFMILSIIETTAILCFIGWYGYSRMKETREEREGEAYLAGFRRGRAVVSGNEIIDFVLNYDKENEK